MRGKVVDRKEDVRRVQVCEVIRAQTRVRLGKAAGRSRSEKHYRERTGSHDGLDKGVKLHITPRLEGCGPGKAAAVSLTTVEHQNGIPEGHLLSASGPEATARPQRREPRNHKHSSQAEVL